MNNSRNRKNILTDPNALTKGKLEIMIQSKSIILSSCLLGKMTSLVYQQVVQGSKVEFVKMIHNCLTDSQHNIHTKSQNVCFVQLKNLAKNSQRNIHATSQNVCFVQLKTWLKISQRFINATSQNSHFVRLKNRRKTHNSILINVSTNFKCHIHNKTTISTTYFC
jgi:hypothetical protein